MVCGVTCGTRVKRQVSRVCVVVVDNNMDGGSSIATMDVYFGDLFELSWASDCESLLLGED